MLMTSKDQTLTHAEHDMKQRLLRVKEIQRDILTKTDKATMTRLVKKGIALENTSRDGKAILYSVIITRDDYHTILDKSQASAVRSLIRSVKRLLTCKCQYAINRETLAEHVDLVEKIFPTQ